MRAGAVWVGEPTPWANPWHIGDTYPDTDHDRLGVIITLEQAVELYRRYAAGFTEHIGEHLAGHDLAYWCPLEDAQGNRMPCHADVLLELANPGWTP